MPGLNMKKSLKKINEKIKKRLEFAIKKFSYRAFEVKKFYVEKFREVKFSGVKFSCVKPMNKIGG